MCTKWNRKLIQLMKTDALLEPPTDTEFKNRHERVSLKCNTPPKKFHPTQKGPISTYTLSSKLVIKICELKFLTLRIMMLGDFLSNYANLLR